MGFGLSDGSNDDVTVNLGEGEPVIWLLPDGVHFEEHVWVRNTSPGDRLIIVAGTSTDTTFKFKLGTNLGLWFRGGIDCPVPLYLVSSGSISLDRDQDSEDDSDCDHVSIYAGGSVHLRGSEAGGYPWHSPMTLRHTPPGDAICKALIDNHYLPNTLGSGGNVQFTMVSGTFQDPPTP